MSTYFTKVVCLECQHELTADINAAACPTCSSEWLDARYAYDTVGSIWPSALANRRHSLWRYAELLPIAEPDPEVSMGEGYTSLIRLYHYERLYEHPHIYIKDERQGPTSSFKDRQAALAVTAMRRAGITECVLASTGNAAAAYAAYCARAGIKLWLFLTSLVPQEKMREAALYGAEVVKVSGTYDDTKQVAAEYARRKGIYLDRGAKSIPGKESMKTLAFEIAEQLGLQLGTGGRWVSPDWYIQAVSGGIGPLGVWKGFTELKQMGLIDRLPKLAIVQAAGCAPMVTAYHAGKEKADKVIPKTLITVLSTGDPGYSYVQLRRVVMDNGGAMIAIEDGETFAAMRRLASKAGFSVEPATAVAFAGMEKMLSDGTISPDEKVVINCSGHTFTAESHILGDQYLLSLELDAGKAKPQEEGLSAALKHLDEQVTTILVVDDNLNDRRLVRRLLQNYKSYRVYEAQSGEEALQLVRERKPDLVVTDLTMPEMDGLALLEKLKHDPETASIPVVVVSAKSLTEADRQVLAGYSATIWQKGGFETRQLVEHVVRTLEHTPLEIIQSRPADQKITTEIPQVTQQQTADGQHVIVVIDDNPSDMRLARRLLETSGSYRVIQASSGRDGLKAIYEHEPDLIILDLMLPDMDGFEVLESLRHDARLRDIPVVVFSAKDLTSDERARLRAGIRSVMEKSSFDRKQFLSIIEEGLK
jgi:threonine synthase